MSRLLILLFLTLHFSLYAQNTFVDSLKLELENATSYHDSARLSCDIVWHINYVDRPQTKYYSDLAMQYVDKFYDSIKIANCYDAGGHGYWSVNEYNEAKRHFKIAAEIAERNKYNVRAAWSYRNLAVLHKQMQAFQDGEQYAIKSLQYFRQLNNMQQIINIHYLLNVFYSEVYADSLINLLVSHTDTLNDEIHKMFNSISLSYLCQENDRRNEAVQYVMQAMALAEKNKHTKGILKAYYNIANYFTEHQKNYDVALMYYEKIEELIVKHELEGDWNGGFPYTGMGELYRLKGQDSLAIACFDLATQKNKENNQTHGLAYAYMKIGDLHFANGEMEQARDNFLKCEGVNCGCCTPLAFHNAFVKLGEVYERMGNENKALEYLDKSVNIAEISVSKNAKITALQAFGDYYKRKARFSEALNYYQRAYHLAVATMNIEGQQYSAEKMMDLLAQQEKYNEAFRYSIISKQLADSLNRMNTVQDLAKLETYFDFRNLQVKQELDQARNNEEIARHKSIRNFVLGGLLLLVVTTVFVYIEYRRKRKDNALLKAQKLSLEKMSKQVHEADQAKLQFFTNVSHEFRTPITLILGMIEKLRGDKCDDGFVDVLQRNAYKLLQLVNHLLDLRRIDVIGMELKVSKGDLNQFVQGLTGSYCELVDKKNLLLNIKKNHVFAEAYFDQGFIEKILTNLISNAIKYTDAGGEIKVVVQSKGVGYAQIDVVDTGIGIAESDLKNIYKRFYRVKENEKPGSGVGLALVKELVTLHKGEIEVTSKIGEGSCFSITIPVEKYRYSDNEISQDNIQMSEWSYIDGIDIPKENKDKSSLNHDKKIILLAEDNVDLRDYIAGIFKDNYQVLQAENGEVAIKLAFEHVPDIVISDVMMPKVSGFELIERLKKEYTTSHIPIVLLTAKNDIGSRMLGFDKGADDYIGKPFDSNLLMSRVENLLRNRNRVIEKFSKQFNLEPREVEIEDADHKFVQKAIDTIENHMSDPNLNVDLLALELGVSRTQLYRKLKALTDYSANQFIRIIRLKRAAQILKRGQNNIAEVMDATGFSNYSHFNNCFKEYFGDYPKEYALLCVNSVN
ncbi:tetratricopeptide repeat protein [Bacteroidales bacterium]|nr:tetratricopeptide repeat protein [Bacteroidales bacterium]